MTQEIVIVVGVHSSIGLTTIRSLNKKGVLCIGISHIPKGVGLWSRFLFKGVYLEYSYEHRYKYCEEISKLYKQHNCLGIFCHHEQQMLDLNEYNELFESHLNLFFPNNLVLRNILSKPTFLKIADELGVRIPVTHIVSSMDEIIEMAAKVNYPIILKPSSGERKLLPVEWGFKCKKFLSSAELIAFAKTFVELDYSFVLQEYISGLYESVGLAIQGEKSISAFQWIAEREHEPGLGCYRRSVPLNSDLLEIGVILCNKLKFEGVAEIEFRSDMITGEIVLMEINPRLWGGASFPIACGIDFPGLIFDIYTNRKISPEFRYKVNLWSRNTYGDIKWLIKSLLNNKTFFEYESYSRRHIIKTYLSSLCTASSHDLDSVDDFAPSVRHLLHKCGFKI